MLATSSSNHDGVHRYRLQAHHAEDGDVVWRFALGQRDDRTSYRAEITPQYLANGDVTYAHSWGMPGSAFGTRSSAHMERTLPEAGTAATWPPTG